jgi:hypothetical protein
MEDRVFMTPAAIRPGVTAVLTSCNRHHLLDTTLSSFFANNTYPLEQIIVVEDGAQIANGLQNKYKSKPMLWLSTGRRVGQIAAIDYAYSRVKTPYIFHLEDDWEFYQRGFIERSMKILQRHRKCLQVWIRSLTDTNGHPVEPRIRTVKGIRWQKLTFDYLGVWHGFSFNPGLRRLADYVAIGGYGSRAQFDFRYTNKSEVAIGRFYKDKGFFAAILSEPLEGCVRHIGAGQHVGVPESQAAASSRG